MAKAKNEKSNGAVTTADDGPGAGDLTPGWRGDRDFTETDSAWDAAKSAVELLRGDSDNKRLRTWLVDTLDIGVALAHFDDDPDGAERELTNVITTGLKLDPDLIQQLNEHVTGNWPEDQEQVKETATESTAQPNDDTAADERPEPVIHVPAAPRVAIEAAAKLKGDLTRYFLDRLQHEQGDRRPWKERPESHQRATIAQVGDMVEAALRDGFALMIADRARVVTGRLDSVTAKEDGIKAVVKLSANADNIMTLLTGAGELVQIAVADPTAFLGFGDQVPVVLDQHAMPLDPAPAPAADPQPESAELEESGDGDSDEQHATQEETLDRAAEGLAASMAALTTEMPGEPPAALQ